LNHYQENLWVLELFHGPTFAFKDVALQFLGNLFDYFLKKKNKLVAAGKEKAKITIIGATSGDTGNKLSLTLRRCSNLWIERKAKHSSFHPTPAQKNLTCSGIANDLCS
jgi:threonine synthase